MKSIGHGAYCRESRFDITQHKYAGGGEPGAGGKYCGGYIEVLEVKNPPLGQWPIVVHEWHTDCFETESLFTEFATLSNAILFFDRNWGRRTTGLHQLAKGFVRHVRCGECVPWFYATNGQTIVGDFVVPLGNLF